jgi:hypothetical protein
MCHASNLASQFLLEACQRNCSAEMPLKSAQFWFLEGHMLEKICPR